MNVQRSKMELLSERFALNRDAVASRSWFVSSLAYDETMERLALPISSTYLPSNVRSATRSAWHVLVSRQSFCFGVPDEDSLDDVRLAVWDVVRPVAPLVSAKAPAVFHGLFSTRFAKPFAQFETNCMRHMRLSAVHHTQDGAFANERLCAARFAAVPPEVLCSRMTCGNHRNQLAEVAVQHVFGLKALSSLYSMSLFFRMGAHWLRLIQAVPLLVEDHRFLEIRVGQPPPSPFAAEVQDYLSSNYRARNAAAIVSEPDRLDDDDSEGEGSGPSLRKAQRVWLEALRSLMAVCNGLSADGKLVHWCYGPDCCQQYDASVTRRRVQDCIVQLVLRTLPTVPCAAKWTKVGPCLDVVVTGLWVHNVLATLMRLAFKIKGAAMPGLGFIQGGHDQQFVEELAWQEVQRIVKTPTKGGCACFNRFIRGVALVLVVLFVRLTSFTPSPRLRAGGWRSGFHYARLLFKFGSCGSIETPVQTPLHSNPPVPFSKRSPACACGEL